MNDHRDVLALRMQDLSREVGRLLGPACGLGREEKRNVLDRLLEHAGWCQHVIEEYGDR